MKSSPVVLISPAMAVPSRYYRPLVSAFEAEGWAARALPRRGFEADGVVASRGADWSYADEIADIARAVAAARAERPDRPVVLLGHSMGGQMSAANQLGDDPADALVLIGASVPHFRRYPYLGAPVLLMGLVVPVVTRLRGFLPKPAFGAPGARTLMREWAGWVRSGRPPFDVPHRVGTPTLSIKLQADPYAVSAATDALVDLLIDPGALTRWTYTRDQAPEGASTDHVQWVKRPQVVVENVVSWWHDRAGPATGGVRHER